MDDDDDVGSIWKTVGILKVSLVKAYTQQENEWVSVEQFDSNVSLKYFKRENQGQLNQQPLNLWKYGGKVKKIRKHHQQPSMNERSFYQLE